MRILVIGAVAAGTSAAAKARRNNDQAEIVIYERDEHISYSGCGLPYYIGGVVKDMGALLPRDSAFFKKQYNIDVFTRHEVQDIDPHRKQITVKNLVSGENFTDHYDKLILATGATAFRPAITGVTSDHVFFLRNVRDAVAMKEFMNHANPKTAVIAGAGFIGFALLENLMRENINVTLVEKADKLTPNLDYDMAAFLENALLGQGIKVLKSTEIVKIEPNCVVLSDGKTLMADMVILATGVRPNVALAQKAGITLGHTGAIAVNATMQTNFPAISACGDCVETHSCITGKAVYRPLGSTANKTGRIAGDAITGGTLTYRGNLGTSIFALFGRTIASTGLSEKEALEEGYDITICHNIKPNKPAYMGGKEMVIKGVADKATGRLLGAQIIGEEGVDKCIDVFATLITYKATVEELFHLDLAYAPSFSTAKDPVQYTGMILDNAMHQGRPLVTAQSLDRLGEEVQILDVRSPGDFAQKGHLAQAVSLPHSELRASLAKLDLAKPVVTYCNKGVTGNAAQNVLLGNGFQKVYTLSGGHTFYRQMQVEKDQKQ